MVRSQPPTKTQVKPSVPATPERTQRHAPLESIPQRRTLGVDFGSKAFKMSIGGDDEIIRIRFSYGPNSSDEQLPTDVLIDIETGYAKYGFDTTTIINATKTRRVKCMKALLSHEKHTQEQREEICRSLRGIKVAKDENLQRRLFVGLLRYARIAMENFLIVNRLDPPTVTSFSIPSLTPGEGRHALEALAEEAGFGKPVRANHFESEVRIYSHFYWMWRQGEQLPEGRLIGSIDLGGTTTHISIYRFKYENGQLQPEQFIPTDAKGSGGEKLVALFREWAETKLRDMGRDPGGPSEINMMEAMEKAFRDGIKLFAMDKIDFEIRVCCEPEIVVTRGDYIDLCQSASQIPSELILKYLPHFKDLEYLLIGGQYSTCNYIQTHLQQAFDRELGDGWWSNKVRLEPRNASHAVCDGIVVATNEKLLAAKRKAIGTYGVKLSIEWGDIMSISDNTAHNPALWGLRRVERGGEKRAVEVIQTFIQKGDMIASNTGGAEYIWLTRRIKDGETNLALSFYQCLDDERPQAYTTDYDDPDKDKNLMVEFSRKDHFEYLGTSFCSFYKEDNPKHPMSLLPELLGNVSFAIQFFTKNSITTHYTVYYDRSGSKNTAELIGFCDGTLDELMRQENNEHPDEGARKSAVENLFNSRITLPSRRPGAGRLSPDPSLAMVDPDQDSGQEFETPMSRYTANADDVSEDQITSSLEPALSSPRFAVPEEGAARSQLANSLLDASPAGVNNSFTDAPKKRKKRSDTVGKPPRKKKAKYTDEQSTANSTVSVERTPPGEAAKKKSIELQLFWVKLNNFRHKVGFQKFWKRHEKSIRNFEAVAVFLTPGMAPQTKFARFMAKYLREKQGREPPKDLSKCLMCRHYSNQNYFACDSKCTQSQLKSRPTIFEWVHEWSEEESKIRKAKRIKLYVIRGEMPLLMEALEELQFQFEKLTQQASQKLGESGDQVGTEEGDDSEGAVGLRSDGFSKQDTVERNDDSEDNSTEDEEVATDIDSDMSHMVSSPKIDREPPTSVPNYTKSGKTRPDADDIKGQVEFMDDLGHNLDDDRFWDFWEKHEVAIQKGHAVVVSMLRKPTEKPVTQFAQVVEIPMKTNRQRPPDKDLPKCYLCRYYRNPSKDCTVLCVQSEKYERYTVFEWVLDHEVVFVAYGDRGKEAALIERDHQDKYFRQLEDQLSKNNA